MSLLSEDDITRASRLRYLSILSTIQNFEYSPLENLDNIYGSRDKVYQPLMHAKCIISQARQVIVGEDNGRNSQYIRLLGECLIEKCWSISTMNGPIICPIQSFMVCRAFHGEIIWGNSTAKFQPTLNLYQHDLAEEDLSSYVIN